MLQGGSRFGAVHPVAGSLFHAVFHQEVNTSLDNLKAQGLLPADIADGLRTHQGRVMPAIYGLIRQDMLLRHGINRTVSQQ